MNHNGSIHQLQRLSQNSITIVYRTSTMVKYVSEVFRHIDSLIHRYLLQVYFMRINDMLLWPLA